MTIMDPITDMLTRIRNANKACHAKVEIPFSKIKYRIGQILEEEGFVVKTEIGEEKKNIIINLKYCNNKEKVIYGIKRVSRCGRRYYVNNERIPLIDGGIGIAILSTSKGVMTDKNARKNNVGGEVICYVW